MHETRAGARRESCGHLLIVGREQALCRILAEPMRTEAHSLRKPYSGKLSQGPAAITDRSWLLTVRGRFDPLRRLVWKQEAFVR